MDALIIIFTPLLSKSILFEYITQWQKAGGMQIGKCGLNNTVDNDLSGLSDIGQLGLSIKNFRSFKIVFLTHISLTMCLTRFIQTRIFRLTQFIRHKIPVS